MKAYESTYGSRTSYENVVYLAESCYSIVVASKRIPTLRNIARECKMSISTVSLALRNHPCVTVESRNRIQTLARAMGWRPNPLASAYMSHCRSLKTPRYMATIGFLHSGHSARIEDLDSYQRVYYNAAKDRAHELGYNLEPIWLHEPGLTTKRLMKVLTSRGIPGLILASIKKPTDILTSFDWSKFAFVTIGHSFPELRIDRVSSHTPFAVRGIIRKTIESGYRRIGLVFSKNLDDRTSQGVLYAVLYEQHRVGLHSIIYHTYSTPITPKGRKDMVEWIKTEKPEVIIGERYVREVLRENRFKIPNQLAFAAFSWTSRHPETAGWNHRYDILGAIAADLVSAQLMRNERGIPTKAKLLLIEGDWVDGPSLPLR